MGSGLITPPEVSALKWGVGLGVIIGLGAALIVFVGVAVLL